MDYQDAARIILERGLLAGVRRLYDDEQYKPGDACRESYEWDLENDCSAYHTTGERAGGTCATDIPVEDFAQDDVAGLAAAIADAVKRNKTYGGHRQAIIVGERANIDYPLDDGEIRIIDAEVLAVIPEEQ